MYIQFDICIWYKYNMLESVFNKRNKWLIRKESGYEESKIIINDGIGYYNNSMYWVWS